MTFLFCGDPHGQFQQIVRAAKRLPEAPIIILGDMELQQPLDEVLPGLMERTWYILGNHDTDTPQAAEHAWNPRYDHRLVHASVHTLPGDVQLAGLGGVFRGAVWYPKHAQAPVYDNPQAHAARTPRQDRWRNGPHLRHWSSLYPAHFEQLRTQRCDVLVLHEAPGYHPHGFAALDILARDMRARLVVHGHQHDSLDSSAHWAEQGFMTVGVPMRGVTAVDLAGHIEVMEPGVGA